jgi:hypothetical protein
MVVAIVALPLLASWRFAVAADSFASIKESPGYAFRSNIRLIQVEFLKFTQWLMELARHPLRGRTEH